VVKFIIVNASGHAIGPHQSVLAAFVNSNGGLTDAA
jgi:hypothetical protein